MYSSRDASVSAEEDNKVTLHVEVTTQGPIYVRGCLPPGSMVESRIAAAVLNIAGVKIDKDGFLFAHLHCLAKHTPEDKHTRLESFRRLLAQRSNVDIALNFA
jgi:hypothetical protein